MTSARISAQPAAHEAGQTQAPPAPGRRLAGRPARAAAAKRRMRLQRALPWLVGAGVLSVVSPSVGDAPVPSDTSSTSGGGGGPYITATRSEPVVPAASAAASDSGV